MEVTTATTIYVVTAGEYSAYGICAMFSRREDAEHYIEINEGKNKDVYSRYTYNIEEWDLDEHRGCEVVSVYTAQIIMGSGEIVRRAESKILSTELMARQTRVDVFDKSTDSRHHNATVHSGVSQEHADKLAVEARQKWLREKGTDYVEACRKRTEIFDKAATHPVHQDPYWWNKNGT